MRVTALGVWTHSFAGPTTSFFVEYDDARVLLDTGVDPIGRMRDFGISPVSCSHIYLSHLHSDHSSGFCNFVFTRELLGRGAKLTSSPITVLGSQTVISGCQSLLALEYPDRTFTINWVPLKDDLQTEIADGVTILTRLTTHSVECHACRLSSSGIDIGFTADSAPRDDFAQLFANCTVLLGEAFGSESAVGKDVNKRGHSTAEDLGRLVRASTPQWVIPFHFGIEYKNPSARAPFLQSCGGGAATIIDPVEAPILQIQGCEQAS